MSAVRDAAVGAAAGLGATLAMSGVMLGSRRAGLMSQSPPREMVQRAAESAADADDIDDVDEQAVDAVASAAHLAFGMSAGAVFGLLAPRLPALGPRAGHGVAYALLVWLVSYMGWAPALGLVPRADRDEPGRQPVMVVAHVVYGAVLGWLFGRATARRHVAPTS